MTTFPATDRNTGLPLPGGPVSFVRREVIGKATLYLGDARELLPHVAEGAVVVTDPVWPNCPTERIQGWEDPDGLWRETMAGLPSVKRLVTVMRADSDPRFLRHVPDRLPFFRSILLPYVIPGHNGRKLGGDETAYWFGPAIRVAPGRRLVPGRAPAAQPAGRPANGHPCSRAQSHFDWLVGWCTDDGEAVIDPFMGSGTTGVAAVKANRPFVGIEIEERFFDLACRRIEDGQRQGDLFFAA